jgi:hypothetical protein
MRTHTALTENINVGTEQILKILPKPYQIEQITARFHLHQKIHIARGVWLSSRHRSEHADIARTMLGGASQDLLAPGA